MTLRFGSVRVAATVHWPRVETVSLALVLSVGVVGFLSLVNSVFGQAPGGSDPGPRGILIAAPVAIIAVFLGLRLASRMGLDRPGATAALNKAAIVSLSHILETKQSEEVAPLRLVPDNAEH